MEMCYDGALVMPSSYAVMDEEEMTYVEGGLSLAVYPTGLALDMAIMAVGSAALGGVTGICSGLVKKYGAEKAALHFGAMASRYATKYLAAKAATVLCGVATAAFNVLLYVTCPGMKLAEYWATHDKNPSTTRTIEI